MENVDPNILQRYIENYTNAEGTSESRAFSLFPESFITLLSTGFIILMVIAGLFLAFYILNFVRNWKVQSAILDLQKDVKEIKTSLASHKTQPKIDKDTPKFG